MTTDPIRDEAVKVLAEALHDAPRPSSEPCNHEDGYGGTGWVQCDQDARYLMEKNPTLARRLALGTAWDAAVAALPEGMDGPNIIHYEDYTGARSWIAEAGVSPNGARVWADAPELALAALAAKLGGGK